MSLPAFSSKSNVSGVLKTPAWLSRLWAAKGNGRLRRIILFSTSSVGATPCSVFADWRSFVQSFLMCMCASLIQHTGLADISSNYASAIHVENSIFNKR